MANEKRMNVVILGFLDHEPMTGYEIKKRIDTSLKYFWSGSFGSIYSTLNALEKEGHIRKEDEEESGRGKIRYAITDAGREQLRNWLQLPVKKDELHYETLLKIFFGGELGAEGTLIHIQNFERKVKQELEILELFEKQLAMYQEEEAHKYYLLTVRFGIETYRAYLKWCEEAKQVLGQ